MDSDCVCFSSGYTPSHCILHVCAGTPNSRDDLLEVLLIGFEFESSDSPLCVIETTVLVHTCNRRDDLRNVARGFSWVRVRVPAPPLPLWAT